MTGGVGRRRLWPQEDELTSPRPYPALGRRAPDPMALRLMQPLLDDLDEALAQGCAADRPFVTLAYAQSVDGSIARRSGERFSLSGPDSLRLTHTIRGRHTGILVGVGTVLADDPELSVRLVDAHDPQPIVVDSQLRTPPGARLLARAYRPLWIGTTRGDPRRSPVNGQGDRVGRAAALESRGARLLAGPALENGLVDLSALLATLQAAGIRHLMVEGGAQIITSFLDARLVDYAVITVAPLFLGGLSAVGPATSNRLADQRGAGSPREGQLGPGDSAGESGDTAPATPPWGAPGGGGCVPRLKKWASHRLGDDLVVAGAVHWPDA